MAEYLTPLKAIRAKCLDCSGESYAEVRLCTITKCPLYPFRDGHNPNRKGIGNNSLARTVANENEAVSSAFQSENTR